jgi:gas vesicle protein
MTMPRDVGAGAGPNQFERGATPESYETGAASGVTPGAVTGIEPSPDGPSTGGSTRSKIRDVKDQVVDQAKHSFRDARDSASSSLNQSRTQAADRIGSIAGAVRSTGDRLRSENQTGIADLTDSLADSVERLSSYLRDRDLSAVRQDVESFARRQPAVAIGVALAVGLVAARFIKSSPRAGGGVG